MIRVITVTQIKSFAAIQQQVPALLIKVLSLRKPAVVNVVFLSAVKARELNWQLRRRRYVPDVLSLNFSTYAQLNPKKVVPFLGELYICWPQVQKQAKANKRLPSQELAWVFLHGLLHLLGYDHEREMAGKIMRTLEQKILTQLSV
ncbi:MAG: rRNA maturation RNase YbeY [Candidatus Komeilibacteria bacterium]|nr:rRNA maturation RNase YbeY [Candidatus Komeilibacteria bacterium]